MCLNIHSCLCIFSLPFTSAVLRFFSCPKAGGTIPGEVQTPAGCQERSLPLFLKSETLSAPPAPVHWSQHNRPSSRFPPPEPAERSRKSGRPLPDSSFSPQKAVTGIPPQHWQKKSRSARNTTTEKSHNIPIRFRRSAAQSVIFSRHLKQQGKSHRSNARRQKFP